MNDRYECFDNVPHDRLLRLVSDIVKDGNVVSLDNFGFRSHALRHTAATILYTYVNITDKRFSWT